MFKFYFLLLFVFFSSIRVGLNQVHTTCQEAILKTQEIVNKLINTSFPELKNVPIELECFQSRSYFFQTRVKIFKFLSSKKIYYIQINPNIFLWNCPSNAVEAILSHELSHIRDYYFGGISKVLAIGINQLFHFSKRKYERQTDLVAIEKGYGESLMEYRNWLYKHIPAQQLKKKKRIYFTPEEISEKMNKM